MATIRLRIVSDGTIAGTRVSDADTGAVVRGVTSIQIHEMTLEGGPVTATITCMVAQLDLVAQVIE